MVVDRTAGWVHGLDREILGIGEVVPLDVVRRERRSRPPRALAPRDVHGIVGVAVTTPLRTVLDLGRVLPAGPALAALDAALDAGLVTHTELLAEVPRFTGTSGIGQLRELAQRADGRSAGLAESVLRLHWLRADLPTPVPGARVVAGGRVVRLALAVDGRRFGAVLAGGVGADDLLALEGAGWHTVVLDHSVVLHGDPASWVRHVEREWHQRLLGQAG